MLEELDDCNVFAIWGGNRFDCFASGTTPSCRESFRRHVDLRNQRSASENDGTASGVLHELGPSPAAGTWSNNTTGTGSSSATAAATAVGLGGTALATSTGGSSSTNTNHACFGAEVVIDDVIISGPGSTATIQVSANIAGMVESVAANSTWGVAGAYASIEVGEDTGSGIVYSTAVLFEPTFTAPTPPGTVISTTLTSSAVEVSTSSTIAVRLFLAGSVVASDNFAAGSASVSLDLSDGMGFPATGPVFILPAGFTANSVDANIVNNQLGAPPAVPALSGGGLAILVLVLAGLGLTGHQRFPSAV